MPAFCTVNGLNVVDGCLYLPRVGVWHADLSVDSFIAASGKATIKLAAQMLVGTFTRSGLDSSGRLRARVVGGNAGLTTLMSPKSYGSVPLKVPLQDALSAAGEVLAATADASLLGTQLAAWSTMAAAAGAMLSSLLVAAGGGATWRVLPDGTIWVGYEAWPASSLPDGSLISAEPEVGRVVIATDSPAILPGTTFSYLAPGRGQQSMQVSYMQQLLGARQVRTILYSE